MTAATFVSIIITGLFTSNILFVQGVGSNGIVLSDNKSNNPYKMGVAVLLVLFLSTLIGFVLYNYVLVKAGIEFLSVIVFMVLIAGVSMAITYCLKQYSSKLHTMFGNFLNTTIINSAILFLVPFSIFGTFSDNIGQVLLTSIFTGLGFMLALILLLSVQERLALAKNDIPKALKGIPIVLISLAIISMAFMGLSGLSFF